MNVRQYARALVALVAAYAVALQAIVLAVGGPLAGGGSLAAGPICSSFGATKRGPAPAGHGHDCLMACPAGGCCGTDAAPPPAAAVVAVPEPDRAVAAAIDFGRALHLSATGAHRCRAPPVV